MFAETPSFFIASGNATLQHAQHQASQYAQIVQLN